MTRPSNGAGSADKALQRETLQAMKTAADMMTKAAGNMAGLRQGLGADIYKMVYDHNGDLQSGVSLPGASGPVVQSSAPTAPDNQTTRPVHTVGAPTHGGRSDRMYLPNQAVSGTRALISGALENRFGAASGATFSNLHDDAGNHIGYQQRNTDGSVRNRLKNEPGLADDVAAAGARAGVSRYARNFEMGGAGRVIAGAGNLGYAGLAVGAVYEGAQQLSNVRKVGSQYQGIYGGGAAAGVGQAAEGFGYGLKSMFSGGLTQGDAEQAFQGVSSLGYSGTQRGKDLDFIQSNYSKMGMSVADSMKLISTASKSLNEDLAGVATGLKSVSDAARATGQSGVTARAAYSSNYSALASSNPGPGNGRQAAILTNAVTNLGRGLSGTDLSGLTSTTSQSMQAAAMGMGLTQYQAAIQKNPGVLAQGGDKMIAQALQKWATDPAILAFVQAQKKATPNISDENLAEALMSNSQLMPGATALAIQQSLAAYSISVDSPTQAVMYLVHQMTSQTGSLEAANNALNSKSQQTTKTTEVNRAQGHKAGDVITTGVNGAKLLTRNVDPVVTDAQKALKGQMVQVQTGTGSQWVSIDVAAAQFTDQIASGTALTQNGQSISDALGGESETNYKGPITTGNANVKNTGLSGKQKDAINSNGQYTGTLGKKGSAGTLTVQMAPELAKLLLLSGTSNMDIETAAASGVPLVPGS